MPTVKKQFKALSNFKRIHKTVRERERDREKEREREREREEREKRRNRPILGCKATSVLQSL